MSELNNIPKEGTWGAASDILNDNFAKVAVDLEKVKNATTRNKGYYTTADVLSSAFPTAPAGSIAYVGTTYPFALYRFEDGSWTNTGQTGGDEQVDLAEYVRASEIADTLFVLTTEEELAAMQAAGTLDPTKVYCTIEQ